MSAEKTYQVRVIEEIEATSPEEALRAFLDRLRNEETEACIEHLKSGEKYFMECQTGERLSMKLQNWIHRDKDTTDD